MSERRASADMVERSIRTREENMDLRARIRELEAVVARYKTVTADGKTAYEQDSVWMVHFDGRITEVTVVHYTHYYSEDEVSRDDVPCNCYSTYEAAKAAAAKHQGGEA